jgi:methylenetetrahydrofolate dehydrogenase (NADP+)/methenyltetrahydrofolate cyclohydrolase
MAHELRPFLMLFMGGTADMAELLKGGAAATALNEKTTAAAAQLRAQGVVPTLAILRVGQRPDDISYEKGAMKRCDAVGVAVKNVVLDENVTQTALMEALEGLNQDDTVHGILLLRPLPAHLDGEAARQALRPEKDVDGVTDGSLAGVFTGSGQGFAPCTAQAVVEILEHYQVPLAGAQVAVVGRSLVVGRPAAMLLMAKGATVTICHGQTKNLPTVTQKADIVVAAIGRMGHFGAEYFRPGQTVVDVGIHFNETTGKMCGDVDFAAAEPMVSAITPVPGGVGAMTTSVLVSHVVEAAERTFS